MISKFNDKKEYITQNKNHLSKGRSRGGNGAALCCVFIPVFFVFLVAFCAYYGVTHTASIQPSCISLDRLEQCKPNDIVIAVMSTDSRYNTAAKTSKEAWIDYAQNIGITVLIFGETNSSSLPAIGLMPEGESSFHWKGSSNTQKTFLMWNRLFNEYKNSKKWFVKVFDDTFVHPSYLVNELCSLDPSEEHYIGHGKLFAQGCAGYVLSKPALSQLLHQKALQKCNNFNVEDITTGKCMHEAGIHLTNNKHFYPKFDRMLDFSPKQFFLTHCGTPTDAMFKLKKAYLDHCTKEVLKHQKAEEYQESVDF